MSGSRSLPVAVIGGGPVVVEDATGDGVRRLGPIDPIIADTGRRPDLAPTRALQLDPDPWPESMKALDPLGDRNLHPRGSVPHHGRWEPAHPEPGLYTVGVASYGRAPTVPMPTGFAQARSVAAAIAGDFAAADDMHLVLPETGVCSTRSPGGSVATACTSCCGPGSAIPVPEITRTRCCSPRG